jgi:HPt (histidine-containing phosphotransfer) domain-containing protein
MNFENRPTHSLRPYAGNARTHSPKQIKQIARSIERFGFNNPVLVDDDDQIIAGHGRVEAAKLLNMKTVPTVRLSHLSEAEKKAYILADNRLAEKAGWDNEVLAIELQGLVDLGFDVLLTGFEPAEVDIIIEGIGDESEQPENVVPEENSGPPVSRLGDVWMLGKHILVCGDSTNAATYKLLMDDDKAEFVFTDPPYNVKIDGNVSGLGRVKHGEFPMASGEMSESQFTAFLSSVYAPLCKYSTDGSIHQICMDWRHMREMLGAGDANYSELKNVCIWNKSNAGMGVHIRATPRLAGLPIIAMTAHATAEERDHCLAAGMRGHIAKPIDPELLYRTVMQFHRSGQAVVVAKPVERFLHLPALSEIAGLDVADGLNRVAGNMKLYRSLLRQFADQQADTVSAVRASLAREDFTSAERLMHTLKGVSGNLGAKVLSGLAAELEGSLRDRNVHSLEAGLSALAMELTRSMDAIRNSLAASAADVPLRTVVSDSAETVRLLKHLKQMLADDDGAALDYLLEARDRIGDTISEADLDSLQKPVGDFDFTAALVRLAGIARHYNFSLE